MKLLSFKRIFSIGLISLGLGLVLIIFLPLLSETLKYHLTPQPIDPTAVSAASPRTYVVNVLGMTSTDYTNANSWFTHLESTTPTQTKVSYFSLSIPARNILDVAVEVNGTNLKKNAIHFPGTPLPGQTGNSVIFGHSALPQFYKPDNPLTIFNPLLKVEAGDEVTVNFDGITYKYTVTQTLEVRPDQVEVLTSDPDKYQLTLITCTPLGTYWRRFVVLADLSQ